MVQSVKNPKTTQNHFYQQRELSVGINMIANYSIINGIEDKNKIENNEDELFNGSNELERRCVINCKRIQREDIQQHGQKTENIREINGLNRVSEFEFNGINTNGKVREGINSNLEHDLTKNVESNENNCKNQENGLSLEATDHCEKTIRSSENLQGISNEIFTRLVKEKSKYLVENHENMEKMVGNRKNFGKYMRNEGDAGNNLVVFDLVPAIVENEGISNALVADCNSKNNCNGIMMANGKNGMAFIDYTGVADIKNGKETCNGILMANDKNGMDLITCTGVANSKNSTETFSDILMSSGGNGTEREFDIYRESLNESCGNNGLFGLCVGMNECNCMNMLFECNSINVFSEGESINVLPECNSINVFSESEGINELFECDSINVLNESCLNECICLNESYKCCINELNEYCVCENVELDECCKNECKSMNNYRKNVRLNGSRLEKLNEFGKYLGSSLNESEKYKKNIDGNKVKELNEFGMYMEDSVNESEKKEQNMEGGKGEIGLSEEDLDRKFPCNDCGRFSENPFTLCEKCGWINMNDLRVNEYGVFELTSKGKWLRIQNINNKKTNKNNKNINEGYLEFGKIKQMKEIKESFFKQREGRENELDEQFGKSCMMPMIRTDKNNTENMERLSSKKVCLISEIDNRQTEKWRR